MRGKPPVSILSAEEWERIRNIIRVEEPVTLPQLKHWMLDEYNINQLYRMTEEMRQTRAITMELVGDIGSLQVFYWYGFHEGGDQ